MLALHDVIKHIVYKTDFIHISYPQTLHSKFRNNSQTQIGDYVSSSAIPYSLHRHEDFSTWVCLLTEFVLPSTMSPKYNWDL